MILGNSLGAGYVLNLTGEMGDATSAECLEHGSIFQKMIHRSLGVTHCKSIKKNEVSSSVYSPLALV